MAHAAQQQDGTTLKPRSRTGSAEGSQSTGTGRVRKAALASDGLATGTPVQGGSSGGSPAGTVPKAVRTGAGAPNDAFRGKAFRDLLRRDPVVARAVAELVSSGAVTGTRSRKVSTRVDPGLMDAAKRRFGLTSEADVINASLAVAGAPDRFKQWLQDPQHTLTDDFELAI